jgi:hypothetical protein
MDPNIAAWMIAGGPRIELHATQRDREQLHAYLESRRVERHSTWVERIAARLRPSGRTSAPRPALDAACCAA